MKLEGKDSTGRLILLVLVLLLTGVLALILPDIVREWVAVLIWYSLWIGRLALNAIPQPLLWILLLVIALPITVGSLAKRGKPAQGEDKAETVYPGQVQALSRWIRHAQKGYYFKRRLAAHLGRLTAETLAHREPLAPREARQHWNDLDVPPEIQAYLQAGLMPTAPKPGGIFSRLAHRLQSRVPASPLDLDPEVVVQFIEGRLGVTYPMGVQYDD